LGALAPTEGEAVFYTWRWYYSATGLGLWIVLVLAMALPKANRTPRTLLILIPLAVAVSGWRFFAAIVGGSAGDRAVFDILIYSLAVGSAVLWLLAHRLARRTWRGTLLAAMAVAVLVAMIGGLSLGIESDEIAFVVVLLVAMMVATVLGYALAIRGSGARHAGRFLAFQAIGTLAAALAGVFLSLLIMTFILDTGPQSLSGFMEAVLVGGFIAGLMVFLIALPFAVLGLSSLFFRRRLLLCLPTKAVSGGNDLGDSASIVTET